MLHQTPEQHWLRKPAVAFIETVTKVNNQSIADIYTEYILPGNVTMKESVYDYDR